MIVVNILSILLPFIMAYAARRFPRLTLLGMPVVCALLFAAGFMIENFMPILAALIILLLVPGIILYFKQELPPWYSQEQRYSTLCFLFVLVFILLFLTLLVILAVLDFAELAIGLLFVAGLGLFCMTLFRRTSQRQSIACDVLTTIGACVQQNLPLAPALDMAAETYRGHTARILRNIHRRLSAGQTLTEALSRGYPQCPASALASVRTAEPINQLHAAFDSIRADLQDAHYQNQRNQSVGFLYPGVVLIIAGFICLGLMTFVVPQFKSIYEEMMGIDQFPRATIILFNLMEWLLYDEGCFLIGFLFLGCALVWLLKPRSRRPQRPYLRTRLSDLVKWWLPGVRWFERIRSQLRTTEYLRLALKAGTPLPDAIGQATGQDINNRYRRCLQVWQHSVEAGGNIAQAAKQSGVGRTMAWIFNQDLKSGATPEALEVLETHYRILYRYRQQIVRSIVTPTTILCLGAIVGFMVYAFYSPAVQLINIYVELYP